MKINDFPMLLVGNDSEEIVRVQHCLAQANLVNPLRIVNDGREAMAYLSGQEEYADRESHPFPSLVLLDLTLSKPSGREVLTWIRSQQHLKNLPVILLIPSTGQGDSEPSTTLAVSYLTKPVDCEPLLEIMKSIGMYWMILDNSRPDAEREGKSLQNPRVLVVDRDADFLRGIAEALRRRSPPIMVDSASDSAEALRRLGRNSLDAVVYERGIQESEEFVFLKGIRAVNRDLPIFVLCTEPDEAFTVRAILKGVTGVLLKLARRDHFADQLHGLLVAATKPAIAAAHAATQCKPAWDSTNAVPVRTRRKSSSSGRPSPTRTRKSTS